MIVSDTTPLSNLIQLDLLDLLRQMWGTVNIPVAVANELDNGHEYVGYWHKEFKMKGEKLTEEGIKRALKEHSDILKKYRVKRIGLFGSYARGEQREDSDIDFLIEFETPSFDNFMDLVFYLEDLFGRKVELITRGSLSPYIQPYLEKEIKWYEAELAVS